MKKTVNMKLNQTCNIVNFRHPEDLGILALGGRRSSSLYVTAKLLGKAKERDEKVRGEERRGRGGKGS